MIVIVTYSPDEGLRESHPIEQLPALLNEGGRVVWVDLHAPSLDESAILAQVFKFHPLCIEDCESLRHQPKIDGYQEFRTRQLSFSAAL